MQTENEKPEKYFKSENPRLENHPFPFRHRTPLQIRFSDIDVFGHINNSVYSSMVDLGKTRYFSAVMGGRLDFGHLGIVVAAIHFDFLAPTHLTDDIAVWTVCTEVGTHSFKLEQRVVDCTSGQVKCAARSVMCAISRDGVSAELPEEWVTNLEAYEQRPLRRNH